MTSFPWLTTIILFPVLASLAIPFIPDKNGRTVRWYALIVGLLDFALIVYTFCNGYDIHSDQLQLVESYTWVPQLDLRWSVGVDGLSMPLVLLTGFITTLAILAAWPVTFKPKLFYFLMLVMYGGQIAVFAVQDMLLFFLVWELELLPIYLFLSIWGGKKRLYASTKFILYTAGGSLFILVAALSMGFYGDTVSFDMRTLAAKDYAQNFQLWMYAGLLIAYGVKLPIIPLHTWLPDAHGEATAPVHMLLAGILLKMGGYALIRNVTRRSCGICTRVNCLGSGKYYLCSLDFIRPAESQTQDCLFLNFAYGIRVDWDCLLHRSRFERCNAANGIAWTDWGEFILPRWLYLRSHAHADAR
jgi:NAD(P)H-quinone oxidoreductase subunit 4